MVHQEKFKSSIIAVTDVYKCDITSLVQVSARCQMSIYIV